MRQLKETRQHWRDRKRLKQAELESVRSEHRRLLELLESGHAVEGGRELSGAWQRYSYVQFAEKWALIYRIDDMDVLLVRVGMLSEIFG